MRQQIESQPTVVGSVEDVDSERREAIRRLGKYAGYTAPALLALLTSQAAAQASNN
jgi:hypothetical protein